MIEKARSSLKNVIPGEDYSRLNAEIAQLQKSLDNMVAARYVQYSIVEEATTISQLKLSLSANFFSAQAPRSQNNKIANLNSSGEAKTVYLRYGKFSTIDNSPIVGDSFTTTLRFKNNVTAITATFINMGEGNWAIESDWLVPAE
ncbi:hypothetical protein [Bhargavaea ginsengi]|uniref:hypothetical protein n=1 Tax=Bhargavaea ginsengi TaxID=426757 RepID=UPI003C720B4B